MSRFVEDDENSLVVLKIGDKKISDKDSKEKKEDKE